MRAFPRDFRIAYQPDLIDAFVDAWRGRRHEGRLARLRYRTGLLADAARQGLRERIARLLGRSGPVSRRPAGTKPDTRLGALLGSVAQEVRVAARSLRRSPGFTTAVLAVLAVSLAGATTLWATVYHVTLAPLGYADEDELVRVAYHMTRRGDPVDWYMSDGMLALLQGQSRTLAPLGYYQVVMPYAILGFGDDPPERVRSTRVSPDFFGLLGVRPVLGRDFQPDEGDAAIVILSHAAWVRRYGRDAGVLGRTLDLDGVRRRVVGVLPRDFRWWGYGSPSEFWTPSALVPDAPGRGGYFGLARLSGGATTAEAQAEAHAILQALPVEQRPEGDAAERSATVEPLRGALVGPPDERVRALALAVALIVLMGAANMTVLMLIRTVSHARESAVRVSLGGSASHVAAPILAQLGVLLLASAGLATVLTTIALGGLRATRAIDLPRLETVHLSLPVLGGGLVAALLIGIAVTTLLALGLRTLTPHAVLQAMAESAAGGRLPRSVRAPLVAGQAALSVVLLSAAALAGRSLFELSRIDAGFDTGRIAQGYIDLPAEGYWTAAPGSELVEARPELPALLVELRARLEARPDVEGAAIARSLPFESQGATWSAGMVPEGFGGARGEGPIAGEWIARNEVDPSFLPLLGVELIAGRWLTEEDDGDARPVALVSRSLAEGLWPAGNAIGSRFVAPVGEGGGDRWMDDWITVVGVVEDVRELDLREANRSLYLSLAQTFAPGTPFHPATTGGFWIFVRARGSVGGAIDAMRSVVAEILPGVPVEDIVLLDDVVDRGFVTARFFVGVFAAFAVLALILAIGGVVAVTAYAVSRRTREIGIRLALGAWSGHVFRLVGAETVAWVAVGVVLGGALAWTLAGLLDPVLYRVTARDLPTLLVVSALFLGASWIAALAPTGRTLQADLSRSLRAE